MLQQLDSAAIEQLLTSCPMALVTSNKNNEVTWVNKTFEEFLGISAEEINNHKIDDLPVDLVKLFTESTVIHVPANSIRSDQWYMCSHKEIDNNGTIIHYIIDVGPLHLLMQERELLRDELKEALAIDEITGMPNKTALFKSLEPQISRSRRYNNVLSIIILRMHNLDKLSEEQKNNLMIPVSQMLNDQVRWADIVGRLSDSDFLLVLPETSADACKTLSENLEEKLETLPLPNDFPKDLKVDASFGYAEWQKGDDLILLMQKAREMVDRDS